MMKRFIQALAFALAACALAFLPGCAGGAGLADGTYDIEVETDSNMFHIDKCELTVDGDTMTAKVFLPGSGFTRIYFGSSEEAASAPDSEIIECDVDANGKYTALLPVSELDKEMPVAAWGQRRDRWYDHTIKFDATTSSTPKEAADNVGPGSGATELAEGEHEVGVTLEGGSGKATVESPAKLVVAEDGTMTATITWSSPNYDKMVVDGKEYAPVNTSGNSVFEIPVAELGDVAVQAETTAMSEPHMIDYTLHFDSAALE